VANDPAEIQSLVVDEYPAMLASFGTSMGDLLRQSAFPLVERLPLFLPDHEHLVAFVQAINGAPKAKIILAATNERLIAIRESDECLIFDAALDSLSDARLETDWWYGSKVTVESPAGTAIFKQLLPGPQGDRIFSLVGGQDNRPKRLDLLNAGQPEDPGHPPLATFWNLAVYADRMIDHEGRHLPFAGGSVTALCDTAGNIAVTRGRNLAAKGVGTLFLGPIGLFGMGNAKERQTDTRELYLLVEGPGWAFTQQFVPEAGAGLRQFAQQIELAARNQGSVEPSEESGAGAQRPNETVATIRELATLRDEGVLTEEEFAVQKQRLLEKL